MSGSEEWKNGGSKIKSEEATQTEWRLMFPIAEKLLRLVDVVKSTPCLIQSVPQETVVSLLWLFIARHFLFPTDKHICKIIQ